VRVPDTQQFKLIIEDDEGRRSIVPVDLGEVSIGRDDGNTIRLNERNISRQHARMLKDGTAIAVEDLESYNGVWINGQRVQGKHEIHDGDLIRIGDFQLELRGDIPNRREETTQRTVMSEIEVTQPQIRMNTADGAPTQPEKEETRIEPTAIIRMDHVADVEACRRKGAASIAGAKAKLVCVSTQYAGTEYEINKTEVVIGRTDENDIAIDHRSVSRQHAKIVFDGTNYKVIDMKSANGTLVNGEEYAQADLKAGDQLELGHVLFRFVPPGASYEFTLEERAAIASTKSHRPGTSDEETEQEPTTPDGGQKRPSSPSDVLRANPFAAIIVAALAVLIVVVLVVFLTGRHTRGTLVRPMEGPEIGTTPIDAGNSHGTDDKLLQKALQMMRQRQWKQAAQILTAVTAMEPNNAEARALLERAESESAAEGNLKAGVDLVGRGDLSSAWEVLKKITEASIYHTQAVSMIEQVRGGLVTEASNKAKAALAKQKCDDAETQANQLVDLQAPASELSQLKDDIEQCRTKTGAPPAGKSRTKGKANKPETKGGNEPAPVVKAQPPPAEDPKDLFNQGAAQLKELNVQGAIDAFSRCVQVDKHSCQCMRALGICHAKAKNGPKAAYYYEQYLRCQPDAPDADRVRQLLDSYKQRATP